MDIGKDRIKSLLIIVRLRLLQVDQLTPDIRVVLRLLRGCFGLGLRRAISSNQGQQNLNQALENIFDRLRGIPPEDGEDARAKGGNRPLVLAPEMKMKSGRQNYAGNEASDETTHISAIIFWIKGAIGQIGLRFEERVKRGAQPGAEECIQRRNKGRYFNGHNCFQRLASLLPPIAG